MFQEQGVSVTINQERYQNVIDTFHRGLQRRQDLRFESQWFQQDGATPHTAIAMMRHFDEHFDFQEKRFFLVATFST